MTTPNPNNPWTAIAKRLAQTPKSYQKLYMKAMSGKSTKTAIKANCLMCVSWVRKEVELCTATACPLYPYRLTGTSITQQNMVQSAKATAFKPKKPPQ